MDKSLASRVFGYLQGVVLVGILLTLYFRIRKERDANDDALTRLQKMTEKGTWRSDPRQASTEPKPDQLESTFPTWSPETPPHLVLGVGSESTREQVEAAYKTLLKRYHPDRFASWGAGYQKRAHHTIILLQKARDKLLEKLQ